MHNLPKTAGQSGVYGAGITISATGPAWLGYNRTSGGRLLALPGSPAFCRSHSTCQTPAARRTAFLATFISSANLPRIAYACYTDLYVRARCDFNGVSMRAVHARTVLEKRTRFARGMLDGVAQGLCLCLRHCPRRPKCGWDATMNARKERRRESLCLCLANNPPPQDDGDAPRSRRATHCDDN